MRYPCVHESASDNPAGEPISGKARRLLGVVHRAACPSGSVDTIITIWLARRGRSIRDLSGASLNQMRDSVMKIASLTYLAKVVADTTLFAEVLHCVKPAPEERLASGLERDLFNEQLSESAFSDEVSRDNLTLLTAWMTPLRVLS